MQKITPPSGAEVVIREAPFKDAMRLKNAIVSELADSGLDLKNITGDTDISELLSPLLSGVLAVDSSEKVYGALFACLARCSYNGEKITEDIFDRSEARADYYPIVLECAKVNILPFFEGLRSRFEGTGLSLEKVLK